MSVVVGAPPVPAARRATAPAVPGRAIAGIYFRNIDKLPTAAKNQQQKSKNNNKNNYLYK